MTAALTARVATLRANPATTRHRSPSWSRKWPRCDGGWPTRPRQTRVLEDRLADTEAQLATVTAQNDRLGVDARERPVTRSWPSRRRSTGSPSHRRVRHLPVALRGRHGRRLHRRPEAPRGGQSGRRDRRPPSGSGGHAQRGAQRRASDGVRAHRRDRDAQGGAVRRRSRSGDRPHRRRARRPHRHPAQGLGHAGRRFVAHGAQVGLRLRTNSQERSRGAHPRRGPRHRLRRHRRTFHARSNRSGTPSSCRICTPTCSGSISSGHPRACCSTDRPAAARR